VKTRLFYARAKLQKLLPQLANPARAVTGATGTRTPAAGARPGWQP